MGQKLGLPEPSSGSSFCRKGGGGGGSSGDQGMPDAVLQ